jgi:hypothetical protein
VRFAAHTSGFDVYSSSVSEVTQILERVEQGDPQAAEGLLPLVYEELRKLAAVKMAQERPGQTLQATALVHEAWLRLVGTDETMAWNGRGHFFGAAAEAMRRIPVDRARQKARARQGVASSGWALTTSASPPSVLTRRWLHPHNHRSPPEPPHQPGLNLPLLKITFGPQPTSSKQQKLLESPTGREIEGLWIRS